MLDGFVFGLPLDAALFATWHLIDKLAGQGMALRTTTMTVTCNSDNNNNDDDNDNDNENNNYKNNRQAIHAYV